ncbi:MAG: hypothetical protein HKN37_14185 [Rhodothermales bacterium]|nr:hypothetical protein [Rhodothermales bacterium]
MRCRPLFAAVCLVAAGNLLNVLALPVQAQTAPGGLIDGYTVGIGLAMYQGDLDRNPGNKPTQFLASGNIQLMAGVDRQLAGGRFGVELHYNRLTAQNNLVAGDHNVVSLDLTYGREIVSPAVMIYAGVGPALVLSSYESQSVSADVLGIANEGAGFDLTIPIGVILQDRVRLSTRVALLDRVDGTDPLGGRDLLSNISIAYRFAGGR